jgi:hypothetical protein
MEADAAGERGTDQTAAVLASAHGIAPASRESGIFRASFMQQS